MSPLPSTLAEWDQVLSDYFLAIGDDDDASDIRSFEVTSDTLTKACHVGPDKETEVETAFRQVFLADRCLVDILHHGRDGARGKDYPGYFVYLALTLFIDSLLDDYSTNGQFRERLARWLGVDHHFMQLQGVASMWKALVRWLDAAISAGKPFRRLVLPSIPSNWTHIGYTRRLSFPSRSDIKLMERFVEDHWQELDQPLAVLSTFQVKATASHLSLGLKTAFEEFDDLYLRQQRRALADHRFWRLLTRVRAKHRPATTTTAEVCLAFNESGEFEFLVQYADAERSRAFASLASALSEARAVESPSLGKAFKNGVLFFYQSGIGRWRAEPHWRNSISGIRLAIAARHQQRIGGQLGQWERDGSWLIAKEPHSSARVKTVLTHARLLSPPVERVFQASLLGGVRVQNAWLGRPRFLPMVDSDVDRLQIVAETADSESVHVRVNPSLEIMADAPLEGEYTIEPAPTGFDAQASWRLRARFVRNATLRLATDCARERLPQANDWASIVSTLLEIRTDEALSWDDAPAACDDLLEALYADGASGWEETEIVELVRRTSDQAARDPWTMLRCLHDGGVIVPRLRQGWKGRAWTLARTSLSRASQGDRDLAIVEGAMCAAAIERFKKAALAAGGQCFRRLGIGAWSVPVIGAVGVRTAEIAETLGWDWVTAPSAPGSVPLAFQLTERHAKLYKCSSSWDWWSKRFVLGETRVGTVQLTRRTHIEGADHDVFRVQTPSKTLHFLSRTAAIAAAHTLAQIPLFEFREDRLVRLALDGGLPDAIAAALRRRQLRAAGPVDGEYAYPANELDAKWLATLLPGCIAGIPELATSETGASLSAARKSMGRVRPQWRDGRLIIQP